MFEHKKQQNKKKKAQDILELKTPKLSAYRNICYQPSSL